MIIDIPKEVQTGYKEIQQFSLLNFGFRPAMLRKNSVRYFLSMRHFSAYTPALFSQKRKTCTNTFYFLLLPDPNRRQGVDTVVFRSNIEVITYSYGRGNTS